MTRLLAGGFEVSVSAAMSTRMSAVLDSDPPPSYADLEQMT